MSSRQEVSQFLRDFKAAVSFAKVHWKHRADATKAHLVGLEINTNQAIELLQELTPDNYSKGPEPDDSDENCDIWVFGCDVAGVEAYIKLVLQPDPKRKTMVNEKIWSFHKAEHRMRYPLRQ